MHADLWPCARWRYLCPKTVRTECTHLLVVEARRQREDAGLRVQREHIVRPVGDHRVRDQCVGAQIRVGGGDHADLVAALRALRYVERVGGLGEDGRIVVRVGDLAGWDGEGTDELYSDREC